MKNFKNKKTSRKAQIFSADFIVASLVFIAVMISAFAIWQYSLEQAALQTPEDERYLRTVAELLVATQGSPSNWSYYTDVNTTYVNSIGLAKTCLRQTDCMSISSPSGFNSGRNVLNMQKIYKLNASYPGASEILGLESFDFRIELLVFNGAEYASNMTLFAEQSYSDKDAVFIISRDVLVEGSYGRIKFYAWRK